jgi:hypothetical protein
MYGEYDFADEKLRDSVGLRVPKNLGVSVLECPEPEIAVSEGK